MSPYFIAFFVVIILRILISSKNSNLAELEKYKRKNLNRSCVGKTVLITGGNDGIGFWTAVDFCRLGASVIIACRNEKKATSAINFIKSLLPNAKIRFLKIDLLDLQTVRELALQCQKESVKIKYLINNAGAVLPYSKTKDGFGSQLQVNYLGHYLLTRLLLEYGLLDTSARVINVSSNAHKYGCIDFDDLLQQKECNRGKVYCNTKLMNVMFSNELSRRLEATSSMILSISLHPGIIFTDISKKGVNKFLAPFVSVFYSFFAVKPSAGSIPILFACFARISNKKRRVYLDVIKPVVSGGVSNPDVKENWKKMKLLWMKSSEALGLSDDFIVK